MAEGTPDFLVWEDDNGERHALNVDLVKTHEDERSATVTSHPVEQGTKIGDHVIHDPDRLTLEIAQTQTPLPLPALPDVAWVKPEGFSTQVVTLNVRKSLFQPGGLLAVTRAVGDAVSSLLGVEEETTQASVFQADQPVDRIGELHDQLISIKTNSRFCTVTFRGRVYPNFLVTKVNWSSAPREVGIGRFKLELESIRIVTNATAELPDPASLRLKPAKQQTNPPKPGSGGATDAAKQPRESILSQATGAGRLSS